MEIDEGGVIMARGFMPNTGLASNKRPDDVSGIFYKKSKDMQPDPLPPAPVPSVPVPSAQQLGGMLNGVIGNIFENNNWWLWVALLIILLNPDIRKKLFGKSEKPETGTE